MSRPAARGLIRAIALACRTVNPLQKARDGAGSAWAGTKRTAGWVKGGVAGSFGKVRTGASNLRGAASERTSTSTEAARDGLAGVWDRVGGGWLVERGKADSRIGAGIIIGAILFVLWIAWTAYVWAENGTAAGLGVLISWPAVLAVLALLAAPFIGAVVLVRRLAANGGPTLAVAGGGTTEPQATDGVDSAGEDESDGETEDEEEEPDDSDDGEPEDDEADGEAEPTDDAEVEEK